LQGARSHAPSGTTSSPSATTHPHARVTDRLSGGHCCNRAASGRRRKPEQATAWDEQRESRGAVGSRLLRWQSDSARS
jgi:hypothetical protein